MRLSPYWLVCVLFLATTNWVSAQNVRNPDDVIASGTAYHIFAEPGEPTVRVLVLSPTASGVYVVGETTNMLDLLALTGSSGSIEESAEYVRTATVRLMREQGGTRSVIYERPFEDFLAEPASYPTLQDGDIFTLDVQQRRKVGVREVLTYTSQLASITLLVLRLTGALN